MVVGEGALFDNVVDQSELRPYSRYRIVGIDNGHGGHTEVTYRAPECSEGMTFPAAHQNTKACFPVKWSPYGEEEPITTWFHKYLVAEVVDKDMTGAHLDDEDHLVTAPTHTRYEYLGGAAWAWDTNDVSEKSDRTWNVWRGYGKVRTLVGDPQRDEQIVTESTFARGMHGDRLPTGTRSRSVSTTAGDVTDHRSYTGMTLEEKTLLDGSVIANEITDPWHSSATATGTRDDGSTARAFRTGVDGDKSREKLADGSWRYLQTVSSLNALGLPTSTEHRGEVASWGGAPVGDVTCEKTSYVDNTSKHILGAVTERTSFTGRCSESATPQTVQSAERVYYDDGSHGAAPTKGLVTQAETLHDWTTAHLDRRQRSNLGARL